MNDFLEITREKYYKAVKKAKPQFAWFSLTDACNLDCKYCFVDAAYHPPGSIEPIRDPLDTKAVCDIIDNVYQADTEIVMFAGGEPTLREDLVDIVRYTSTRMSAAMNTNGYVCDEAFCKALANAGLAQVKVSIDGMEKNHDHNRGKGSFQRVVDAAKNFRRAGVPKVVLILTLSNLNYDDLDEVVELSMGLGVDFTMVEFLPLGKASEKREWTLSKEQLERAQRYLFEAQKRHGWERVAFENRYIVGDDEHCKGVCMDPNRQANFYDFCVGCISGLYSYCILATGKVVAGDIMTLEVGDLRTERMKDIWKNAEVFKTLRNRENLKGKCGKCEYRYVCGGCRRRAYAYTGDLMAADPGCWRTEGGAK